MNWILNGEIRAESSSMPLDLPWGKTGLFETLLVREGQAQFMTEHFARFVEGCRALGFCPPVTLATLRHYSHAIMRANGISNGVLRYAAWDEGSGTIFWRMDVTPPRPHMSVAAYRVAIGPNLLPSSDSMVKHLRRSAWLAPLREARTHHFDEVLFTTPRGEVVEGAVSNVFFVRGGRLHTPSLCLGPLPGIIRSKVIAISRQHGWPVNEGVFSIPDFVNADEVWFTNSLVGIRLVHQIDDHILPEYHPSYDRMMRIWTESFA